jgi:cyclophilin family peptidyl-prolyl cis-trans isomerase/HEAT repeat protein
MKRSSIAILILTGCLSIYSQVPLNVSVEILKAEDARHYSPSLQSLMFQRAPAIRSRAALAAGRIGDDAAVDPLAKLLENDASLDVRVMAAFALGEVESAKGADAILRVLNNASTSDAVRARAVEAAGKIAAANSKDPQAKPLGDAILKVLDGSIRERETILLAITAALRARPEGTEKAVARFLTSPDARIRADAANTLARVRAKNANPEFRNMLVNDLDPIARANAARALGAAEDKDAVEILLIAAINDNDSRVRVSAVRSLAQLRDKSTGARLLDRGEHLLDEYKAQKKPDYIPSVHGEFVEVAAALGRIMANSYDQLAVDIFRQFGKLDNGHTTEVYLARIRIAPGPGDEGKPELTHWRQYSTLAQIVGEFAVLEPTVDLAKTMKSEAPEILRPMAAAFAVADPEADASTILAAPDALRAYARFKTPDLGEMLRTALQNKDVYIRAAAAGLIADLPPSGENAEAVRSAFTRSLISDKQENDAQLAFLDSLYKIDKNVLSSVLNYALSSQDYLVRRKALDLIKDRDAWKSASAATKQKIDGLNFAKAEFVWRYSPKSGTKLGQILNSDADYRRALSRKNGSVKAVITTQKGTFTIDLLPEDAPLTVDNFVKLARSRYFDGLEVHRVVSNFVMQDGDPIGNGSGGPGWSIRCEVNMVSYNRGAVGMALSGKDTGGSQWFVTHSPQPHLDGGYTVFGKVNETGMKVVDNIVRGDKILSVLIVGR